MARGQDALELLLPDADARVVKRARSVTHFLRLLSDDARPAQAHTVGIDLDRARDELVLHDRQQLEQALCDLLRHHLAAATPADSFAWMGETELDVQTAWRRIEEFRDDLDWLAGVPGPGEPTEAVAERLLECLERLGPSPGESSLWRARFARVREGVRAAEKRFRAALERTPGVESDPGSSRALIAGVAECLLDRGAVREARSWLTQHLAVGGFDARLRQLACWARLLSGDVAGAKSALVGLRPWSGAIPASLVDLRAQRPEWLPCLAGRSPVEEPRDRRACGSERPVRERSDLGAVVLGVFVFQPGSATLPLYLDVAPGLKDGIDAWLADRDGACAVPSEAEHRLVVSARAIVAHRDGLVPLSGALGRDTARSLALSPILDADGEVAGWLHIECEHHLLPSLARLESLARGWQSEVMSERDGPRSNRSIHLSMKRRTCGTARPNEKHSDLTSRAFLDLMQDLGIKTSQRRWWGFEVEDGRPVLVAQGGEGTGLSDLLIGRRRALTRALSTAGPVLFEEPDPRLSIHADAGSGVVLVLRAAGRTCGLLAIESSRRHDFRAGDVERYEAALEPWGLALRLAQFRVWHRERFGFDIWFDPARPDFSGFADHLMVAARSRSPVVLAGPQGAGKLILSRWLHFESRLRSGPQKVFSCGRGALPRGIADLFASARGGSLVLDDVEEMAPVLQEELLRWLEGVERPAPEDALSPASDSEPQDHHGATGRDVPRASATVATNPWLRLVATTRTGLFPAMQSGRLRHDLARRLDRLQMFVPALKERREDILSLVDCLSRRFAAEEGLRAPVFTDEAQALMWRQPWEGNLRELENIVYKLVLLTRREVRAPRPILDADDVAEIAARYSLDLVRRLPSRHPLRSDLIAALRGSRRPGGRLNKSRAAMFLGWDPDTLVSRMQEAGIHEASLDEKPCWRVLAPDEVKGSGGMAGEEAATRP